ncbi:MAG: NAD(+) synthase [Methanoregula sp.]|jgi:NAD+ synthase|nr:NAD(+) synthase [Methanoregula sp.]
MSKKTSDNGFDIKKEMLANVGELKEKLPDFIHKTVTDQLNRDGIVIGVSGGVDSALIATLAVEALGSDHVYGLILPEKESSPSSRELALRLCKKLKIPFGEVPITPMLESFNIYLRKEALLKELFPQYDPAVHTTNLFLPPGIASESLLALPSIRLSDKNGSISTKRLSAPQYLNLISLQNVKQRTRMIVLYMQAEKMNYSVSGTTNKSELLTGYFVKFGDGGVDIEPIADLYKLQVYKLSELLDIDKKIISRAPSPDTWSHFTSDEDFYLRMPYDILDQLLYAEEHDLSAEIVMNNTHLTASQIESAKRHIHTMKNASRLLQLSPPVYMQ